MEKVTVYVILVQVDGCLIRIEYCSMKELISKKTELIEQ